MAGHCTGLPENDVDGNIGSGNETPPDDEVLVPWIGGNFLLGRQKEHVSLPDPLIYPGRLGGSSHVTGCHMECDNWNQEYTRQDE